MIKAMKKEDCQNIGKSISLVTISQKEYVTYKVSYQNTVMFDSPRYFKIFDTLKEIENEMNAPLKFTVSIDFIVLGALEMLSRDENYLKILKKVISKNIFYLINDICLEESLIRSQDIANAYLYPAKLKRLNEYYSCYERFVNICFEKKYSSLPLFNVVYNNALPTAYSLLSNISLSATNIYEPLEKRTLAYYLIVEIANKIHKMTSDKEKEDYYDKIYVVNKRYNELNETLLTTLKDFTLDDVYLLLMNNSY